MVQNTADIAALQANAQQCKDSYDAFLKKTAGWSFLGRDVVALKKDKDSARINTACMNTIIGLSYIPIFSQMLAILHLCKNGVNKDHPPAFNAKLIIDAIGLGPLCIFVDAICSISLAILARKAVKAQEMVTAATAN